MVEGLGRIGFGLFGLAVLIGITWLFSNNKRAVDWKLVATGITLQIAFAALVILVPGGRDVFDALDGASLHALCRKLVGNGTVVVTLGSVGVFVSHADENLRGDTQPYYRVGAEQVQAIDTTGAGDAFNGALAASLAQVADAPFARHVRFANQFAGRSTEKEGAAAAMPRFTPADAEAK
ncbi:PfkB family carbohydrate kinase [Stenotrophomonas maltophilia]|uniref:PfkB family carbohydrate kinase n=1 Tax=Stenotrophomonas maltophilia TaxID=40324 RepID=UPI000F785086|nr:PfkB family carbohydrate kinase [Stenotrophomonas maltophilia]RSC49912.1 hypothetical protein EGS96_12015 [Stenotrophomonas maltophilia]